MQNPK